mgnify:CR=1 FL=1
MYKMSSSAWSNYSNQAAALRGSLQAPEQEEGAEKENDRKAFLAEAIQGTAQFIKERVAEKVFPTIAGFAPAGKLISKVTNKSVTPLKDAAATARQAAKDAEAGIDKAGMDESEELAGFSARTAAAKVAQVAAQSESESSTAIDAALTAARTAGSGTIRVASDAARAGSALTREGVDDAAAAGLRTPAETLLSRLVPLADTTATSSAATAADAAGSSASRVATAGAAKLSKGLEQAGQGVKDAEEVEGAAKDAADIAKAARVAKALKDAKEAETVADASEEGGDPFGVVIGGLIALGTAWIGSRVQVHSVVKAPPPNVEEISSYGSVAGA